MNQKIKILSSVSVISLLFLIFRGILWLVNNTTPHPVLDNITNIAAYILFISSALIVMDKGSTQNKSAKVAKKLSAITLVVFGVIALVFIFFAIELFTVFHVWSTF
jgi:cytochrome bd-type quinol oxidase subunit 2